MYSVLDAIVRIPVFLHSLLATTGLAAAAPCVLLACLGLAAVRQRLLNSKPCVQNAQTSTSSSTSSSSTSNTRATQELAETPQDSPSGTDTDAPFTSTASPRSGLFSFLGSMLAPTFIARPIPLPVPSPIVESALRSVDVEPKLDRPETAWPVKQPYDAFLVLDVEATCKEGTDFNWPNEIIEWPVCLLRWQHKDNEGRAKELYIADEFRSFVKPTWKPQLTAFCTSLTGITQTDVDRAPKFPKVLDSFEKFLVKNGLVDGVTGERLQRFTWCSDGPFDVRDFVVKQCFISKIKMPEWLKGDVLDVRKVITYYLALQDGEVPGARPQKIAFPKPGMPFPRRRTLNIPLQLRALNLPAFVGRQHSGIDDTRNIARIVTELAKRGIRLEPNTTIFPGRRWQWMGSPGQILEEYCFI